MKHEYKLVSNIYLRTNIICISYITALSAVSHSVFRRGTSPSADFAEVVVLSLDIMWCVHMCVCRNLFDATQSRHNSSMPIYMYIATKFLSTKLVRLCTMLGWLITRCIYATLTSKKISSIDTRSLTYTILTTAPFSTFSIHHLKCSSWWTLLLCFLSQYDQKNNCSKNLLETRRQTPCVIPTTSDSCSLIDVFHF